MIKINITSFSALVIAFFMLGTVANAQTIWGVGTSTGVTEAEFATPFVETGSYNPTTNVSSWTALSVNDNAGSPGTAYWVRDTVGYSQGTWWSGTTPITSPSFSNGVAMFDSDFLNTGGTQGGTGTSQGPHRGELISPRIDLTGYSDKALIVNFYTLYRKFGSSKMEVGFSTDDGVTWTDMDIQSAIPNLTQGMARVLFSNVASGVSNMSQCRLRFTFDGDYYFIMVDDVSIEVAPTYDIAMGGENTAGNYIVDAGDNVKIGGRRYVALSNLDPNDLREWSFGGRVVNLGGSNILPSASPRLHVSIDYEAPDGVVTQNVYRDSLDLDTVVAGSAEGAVELEFLDNIDFILSRPDGGDYYVTYWASHDSIDGNTSNDTAFHVFTVTTDKDTTTGKDVGYISNTRRLQDGGARATSSLFPGGGPFAAWEIGTVYYFPNAARDTIHLDSVSFRYRLPSSFTGNSSQTLYCNVYKVDATAAGGTLDDGSLLAHIGLGSVSLTNLNASGGVQAGDFGSAMVTNLIDAVAGGAMPALEDNAFYYVAIQTNTSLANGPATFDAEEVPWIGSENRSNYYMNTALTGTDSLYNPSPLNTVSAAGISDWSWAGFSSGAVPSIGLYISQGSGTNSVTTVWDTEGAELNIYPNPASDVLNVEFTLENAADVTYIITDMTGRVVSMTQSNNVTSDVQQVNVGKMPVGVYMITAKTEAGTSTKRFVVK